MYHNPTKSVHQPQSARWATQNQVVNAWPTHERQPPHNSYPPRRYAHSLFDFKRHLFRGRPLLSPLSSFISTRRPSRSTLFPRMFNPTTSTIRFVLLCGLWYATSALSSNTGKTIMTQFRYPITLTFVQFGFVALYCLLFMSPVIRFTKLRMPTVSIVRSTLPMGMFQVVGHVCSSMAISRIPVSSVHTIKALSPLFTVAAYALLFKVKYSPKTYVSLFPLTVGVMLACSFDMSTSNSIGLLCAFGSALVFVSSNIFFKRIMPSNATQSTTHKLDKLNLLFYSSAMAFLLMIPIWLYYDLRNFVVAQVIRAPVSHPSHGNSIQHSVIFYFFTNGTVHFAQNIIAFVILSSTSPVTYSIASLIKRVVVICIAIVWFNQVVHPIQGLGIALTFLGLYMYNGAKADVDKGERKIRRVEAARDMVLPSTRADIRIANDADSPPPERDGGFLAETTGVVSVAAYGWPRGAQSAGVAQILKYESQLQPQFSQLPRTLFKSHPQPSNLTIKITMPGSLTPIDKVSAASPVDSYPSPPLSLDSPPSHTTPLLWERARSPIQDGLTLP